MQQTGETGRFEINELPDSKDFGLQCEPESEDCALQCEILKEKEVV